MEYKKGFIERNAVLLKMMIVGILALFLMIPLSMVHGLISERQNLYQGTTQEIAQSFGVSKTITGPFISVPYEVKLKSSDGKIDIIKRYIHLMPEDLEISGDIDTTIRQRSIYQLMAYHTVLNMKGSFKFDQILEDRSINPAAVFWEDAYVNLGISEPKGIEKRIEMTWGDTVLQFRPGLNTTDVVYQGASVPVSISADGEVDFNLDLHLKGSESLNFHPCGRNMSVTITSKCPNPGFFGDYLPNHDITDQGFEARWDILESNKNIPQSWIGDSYNIQNAVFGVNLFLDIEHYHKTYRSVKYAMLLVCLSFLSFFFIEVLNGRRLHPVQYGLIGLVMVVFYVLLLSLSEHLGFDMAYFIAAGSVLGLLFFYIQAGLRSMKLASLLCFILAAVYGFIYVILQLANYSLVVGSIGLFVFLALIMILTRKVDWYNLTVRKEENDR